MKYTEVKERFMNGESIQNFFGIRKNTYTIGKDGISSLQYDKIRDEFEGKHEHKVLGGGYTKHILTYKPE